MSRKGIPMTREERLWIIKLNKEGYNLAEIEEKTGFKRTIIKQTIEDDKNGLIDAQGYKKGASVGESNGNVKILYNPVEFVNK